MANLFSSVRPQALTVRFHDGREETLAPSHLVVCGSRAKYLPIQETQGLALSLESVAAVGSTEAWIAQRDDEETVWVADRTREQMDAGASDAPCQSDDAPAFWKATVIR